MKQANNKRDEEKVDELKRTEPGRESNPSNFISGLRDFIIATVDERIKQKLKENEKPEVKEENTDLLFYTPEEVCKILKISRTSLYTYSHKTGRIKFQRIGRRILYTRKDILNALTSIKKYERLP
jgi:predicted transcriptional regulator YheO